MKFVNWLLDVETSWWKKFRNIIYAIIILYVWSQFIFYVLKGISGVNMLGDVWPSKTYINIDNCLLPALWEELWWRVVPISIAWWFIKKFGGKELLLPTIIGTSISFAMAHFHQYTFPQIALLEQGILGFIFACLYIKNNFSYWSVAITHCLWNTLVFIVLPHFPITDLANWIFFRIFVF